MVEVSSLLGTLNTQAALITPSLLSQLLLDAKARWCASPYKDTTRHKIKCAHCAKDFPKVHWVVLGVDHLAGPWCIRCLKSLVWTEIEGDKGLKQDLYVLAVTSAIDVLRQLHNVHVEPITLPSGSDSDLVF